MTLSPLRNLHGIGKRDKCRCDVTEGVDKICHMQTKNSSLDSLYTFVCLKWLYLLIHIAKTVAQVIGKSFACSVELSRFYRELLFRQ